ncbi:MAG: InlB B-repeat-containing protein, partial [Coriobacteriales bacterium]|nr:InlB B-repeat-containing protein [Coriobacteriales bacterium]
DTDIAYTVETYQESLTAGDFAKVATKSFADGETGKVKQITPDVAATGFTLDSANTNNVLSLAIDADTLKNVFKVYYTRNKDVTVTYKQNASASDITIYVDKDKVYGSAYTLIMPQGFAIPGYHLRGWDSQADDQGIDFTHGMTIPALDYGFEVYAQWKSDPAPSDPNNPPLGPVVPPADDPKKPSNKDKTHKVDFREGKGSKVADRRIAHRGRLGKLPKSFRNGYLLKGWYSKQRGGKKFKKQSVVSGNLKLYAHWKKLKRVKTLMVDGCWSVTIRKHGRNAAVPVSYLRAGKKVDILKKANKRGWIKVKVGKKTGYIYKKYLKLR